MSDLFEKPSVERLVTGGTYVIVFAILAAVFGWIFMAIASRSDIGIGGDLLGYFTTVSALQVMAFCISGGFHQALSKYLSETLVESKERALRYAKAAFLIFNSTGLILFSIFITVSIIVIPHNLGYGLVFVFTAIIYYLTFFRDNFLGNLAARHRFDYIGKMTFFSGISGVVVGCFVLFLIPKALNAFLLPLLIITTMAVGIVLLFYYGKKVIPYSLSSVFRGAPRKETIELLKYGFYCIIPNIVFSGALMWIQTLWYSGFFSFGSIIVTANGLILGYSGVVFSMGQFGWAQIPAVSEAKSQNDYKLIDDYIKNTLHYGFNLTAFFLIIYIGLSHYILFLFHGEEYLIAHIPFIILNVTVAILGVEFLICTLLMGLGEGKKAALLIAILTIIQIILVPILIFIIQGKFGPDSPICLYAGPSSLLISSITIFPLAYHYLKKYTNNPPRVYSSILAKAAMSIIITLLVFGILDLTVFPHNNAILGLVVSATILFGFYMVFMLIFGGFSDKDIDVYENFPLFKHVAKGMRWLLHHSPFYVKEEESEKEGV